MDRINNDPEFLEENISEQEKIADEDTILDQVFENYENNDKSVELLKKCEFIYSNKYKNLVSNHLATKLDDENVGVLTRFAKKWGLSHLHEIGLKHIAKSHLENTIPMD
jgi:hypothetical protein